MCAVVSQLALDFLADLVQYSVRAVHRLTLGWEFKLGSKRSQTITRLDAAQRAGHAERVEDEGGLYPIHPTQNRHVELGVVRQDGSLVPIYFSGPLCDGIAPNPHGVSVFPHLFPTQPPCLEARVADVLLGGHLGQGVFLPVPGSLKIKRDYSRERQAHASP